MNAIARIALAIRRCKPFVVSIFLTYIVASAAGMLLAHSGNPVALEQRDRIVKKALASDSASIAHRAQDPARAIFHDFAGNLFLAAIPQAIGGLAVVPPYLSVAYQGWIGGIVSVDGAHRSRFRTAKGAAYYVTVLLLQFVPFSLSIGAGVRCGVELYRGNARVGWAFWRYRLAREVLVDLGCLFALAVPLFLVASTFEFLSPWNR